MYAYKDGPGEGQMFECVFIILSNQSVKVYHDISELELDDPFVTEKGDFNKCDLKWSTHTVPPVY